MARAPVRSELLEEAAEASRLGLRTRRERAVAAARPILQTAVAASPRGSSRSSYSAIRRPFFAPIAAVVTLGLTIGERRQRAVELAIGVAVGIAIADLLVAQIGTGTWQIGVTVALAMFAAILVGGGPLLASQAAASAVLVVALQPPEYELRLHPRPRRPGGRRHRRGDRLAVAARPTRFAWRAAAPAR